MALATVVTVALVACFTLTTVWWPQDEGGVAPSGDSVDSVPYAAGLEPAAVADGWRGLVAARLVPVPEPLAEVAAHDAATQLPAVPAQEPLSGARRIICAVPWPCGQALAVAACESGLDYYADPSENPGHRGAFQLSYVHAPKFAAHGWSWDTDGLVLERNVAIAYEIYAAQGWRPWACAPP